MIRVVLDTNIIISGLVFRGKPGRILELAADGALACVTSDSLRSEVEDVLARKFSWSAAMIVTACEPLWTLAEWVMPSRVITACSDPDDNRVLECAAEAEVHFIVTGDHHLLTMKRFEDITILTAEEFLQIECAS